MKVFNQLKSFPARQANAASHKSLESLFLQAFSSALFMILGIFIVKHYEFNPKEQLEGAEPYR